MTQGTARGRRAATSVNTPHESLSQAPEVNVSSALGSLARCSPDGPVWRGVDFEAIGRGDGQRRLERPGSEINFTDAYTVPAFGAALDAVWMAKIVGEHPQYGLHRLFCRKHRIDLPGEPAQVILWFELRGPGIYEFRSFADHRPNRAPFSGFVLVDLSGFVRELPCDVVNSVAACIPNPGE